MNRERNGLLSLKSNDFVHLIRRQRRRLDKLAQNRLPGNGVANVFLGGLHLTRCAFEASSQLRATRGVQGRITAKVNERIIGESQGTLAARIEAREPETLRTQIEGEMRFLVSHERKVLVPPKTRR